MRKIREEKAAPADDERLSRARAMVAAGGGGAMLPLITGFHY
jgi:hypothetical protein